MDRIILLGLAVVVGYWLFVREPQYGNVKIYQEYPPIETTGWLSFNEWQKQYGGNSELDYQDWLIGV